MSEQAMLPRGQGQSASASPADGSAASVAPSSRWSALRGQNVWRSLIGLGIAWMVLGMVVMPAGISFNPGKGYQASLVLLLYLPALWLSFRHRAQLWRALLPVPLFRVFLLLLLWAVASLLWSHLRNPGDELGRLMSVLAFVLAWQCWDADSEEHPRHLLFGIGVAVAICAAVYSSMHLLHSTLDERIVGVGTIGTTNYAAALMGAMAVLLTQLVLPSRTHSALRWIAVAVLLLFVGFTQTRNVWLALCVCLVLAPLWRPERWLRWAALVILLLALLSLAFPLPILLERGTSLRPQLFMQSVHRIELHPLLGIGQGAPFTLMVAQQPYTHTHNVLTEMAVELGIPGLLLTIALWALVGWQGWRHRHSMRGKIIIALWVYASVVLQFDMPQLLDSPRPGWVLIWLPFALALALAIRERAPPRAAIMPG